MPFNNVEYLEWAHLKPSVKYNLAGSSIGVTEPEEFEFSWEGLRFSGPNHYGYAPLLGAIAHRYGVQPCNVVTASGASMANFLVCAALIQPGDEVIVEKPCYGPMLDLARALGGKVTRMERSFQDGFQINIRKLRQLAGPQTRLIILTDLHNPSGVKLSQESLEEIGEIARQLKIHVLIDEVYLDFLFDKPHQTVAKINEQFISTNSLTKVYGLDGLRCGWILAEEELAKRMWRVRDYVDANGPFPAEFISARLFPKLPQILSRARKLVEGNFSLVRSFMESMPEISWVPPHGGVICFPRHRNAAQLNARLKELLRKHDTLVVPGRFFEAPAHFRLGFGIPQKTLKAGLANLAGVFSA